MASAFSVFAAGGIYNNPRSILEIRDRFGEQIAEYPIQRRVAISAETAYIMTDMLSTVINRGTGGSARWKYNFHATAAGKTGTTNDFTDAWFIGFTPDLVCGVWVGLDDPQQSLSPGFSGAVAALPIWAMFMKMAYDSLDYKSTEFEIPPGVVRVMICADTKQIATPYCPQKIKEVFRQDARPLKTCSKHRRKAGY
jgi:penicillin-binding protein 1A